MPEENLKSVTSFVVGRKTGVVVTQEYIYKQEGVTLL